MAKKTKAKKSSTRKHRSLSSGGKRKTHRRKKRAKGFLSEGPMALVSKQQTVSIKPLQAIFSSGVGGGLAIAQHKLIPANWGKLVKVLGTGALALFGISAGMPILTAGYVGGTVALTFQNGLLGEDDNANFADEETLSDMPIFLDENDRPMVLEEDASTGTSGYRYLEEDEIQHLMEAGILEDADYEMVG